MPAMAGADILTGAGHLQGGLVVNFAQLVIDDEIVGIVNRGMQGIDVDEENLGYEAIRASIESDNLLMHPHTLRHLRSDRYRTRLMTRSARATWEAEGSKSMRDRAIEKVKSLLANHHPKNIDEYVQKGIDELLIEADRKLIVNP
jgi:trimethylamine---corrinoid protein Co-methyltransferase